VKSVEGWEWEIKGGGGERLGDRLTGCFLASPGRLIIEATERKASGKCNPVALFMSSRSLSSTRLAKRYQIRLKSRLEATGMSPLIKLSSPCVPLIWRPGARRRSVILIGLRNERHCVEECIEYVCKVRCLLRFEL
jgi:hypothetical protein